MPRGAQPSREPTASGGTIHSRREVADQLALESARRGRLAVPAIGAGVLYLLSGIIISSSLSGAPTVGVLQGLGPVLHGEANPLVSPRAAEVRFISHHAFNLIAGSTLAAIAIGALTVVLLLLVRAARFRRPEASTTVIPLVIFGGAAVAIVSLGHQVVGAILTHNFATGRDFSDHAVDMALTKGTANLLVQYLDLIAGLTFAAGIIMTMLASMRVGLIVRWLSYLGIFSAILIFLPIGGAELEVIPAFWMVCMGILFIGRWPGGDPPAWAAGEARPWPSAAEVRAQREAEKQADGDSPSSDGQRRGAARAARQVGAQAGASGLPAGDAAPEPAVRPRSSSRRGRKRGSARPPSEDSPSDD